MERCSSFCRNNVLDANNFFTNAASQPRAPFHQNQFGAAVGGPIVRNKTFFFADYQGTRQTSASGSSITDVPPAALRGGDFSKVRHGDLRSGHAPRRTYRAGDRRSVPGQHHPAEPSERDVGGCRRVGAAAELRSGRRVGAQLLLSAGAVSNTDQGDVRVDHTLFRQK